MHLLGISLLLAYLLYTNLASDFSHSDYDDYYEQEQMDEPVSLRESEAGCCVCVSECSQHQPTCAGILHLILSQGPPGLQRGSEQHRM